MHSDVLLESDPLLAVEFLNAHPRVGVVGAKLVVVFNDKDLATPQKPLDPTILLNLDLADGRSFEIDAAGCDRVVRYVEEWFPGLDPEPARAETCLYTTTPTEDFVIELKGAPWPRSSFPERPRCVAASRSVQCPTLIPATDVIDSPVMSS